MRGLSLVGGVTGLYLSLWLAVRFALEPSVERFALLLAWLVLCVFAFAISRHDEGTAVFAKSDDT